MSTGPFPYLNAVLDSLPDDLHNSLSKIAESDNGASRLTLDRVLCLVLDGPPLVNIERGAWIKSQENLKKGLQNLSVSNGTKRPREDDDDPMNSNGHPNNNPNAVKKQKLELNGTTSNEQAQPLYTLRSISVTSPIRKKVDITITNSSILLINPSSGERETTISLEHYNRAFFLPTPGKAKPYFTIVFYSDARSTEQFIFGSDAKTNTVLKTTSYQGSQSEPETYPKGTSIEPIFRQFLSHLPPSISIIEYNPKHFASSSGEAGVNAYRGAKDGHLYFFGQGIFFGEKKPCEWVSNSDLDNVRTLSVTGRTFSVYVQKKGKVEEGDDDEEELPEGEVTEYSILDGKEMDVVTGWIRRHEHLFGKGKGFNRNGSAKRDEDEESARVSTKDKGKGKAVEVEDEPVNEDGYEAESDDESFHADSDSDGGSPSESSSGNEDGGDEDDGREDAQDTDGEDSDEALDEAHHPLLRPGAMPRMSKAAMAMVVDMVEDDMGLSSSSKKSAKKKKKIDAAASLKSSKEKEIESEDDEAGSNYSL